MKGCFFIRKSQKYCDKNGIIDHLVYIMKQKLEKDKILEKSRFDVSDIRNTIIRKQVNVFLKKYTFFILFWNK